MLSAPSDRQGFTLVELAVAMSVIAILASFAAPALTAAAGASETLAAEETRLSIASNYGGIIARNAATNPGALHPTLEALSLSMQSGALTMASDRSGLCAGPGLKSPTFADAAMATATASPDDAVLALGPHVVPDSIHCPR